MKRRYNVAPAPHLRERTTTRRVMLDVCIALLPAGLAGIWFFGLRAALLMIFSVAGAVCAEWVYQWITKRPYTVGDCSAVVTGLLLAYNLPPSAPRWMAVIGSAIAIVLVKQCFGGIGQNFMNPALAARAVLLASWAGVMSTWSMPTPGQWMVGLEAQAVDVIARATPLAVHAEDMAASSYKLRDLFLGGVPGTIGETSKLALLIGGGYLLMRRVINWRIPVYFLGVMFLLTWLQTGTLYSYEAGADSALYQLLSGGAILGALFMATDYAAAPVTDWGKIIYGVGCGLILFLFRAFHARMAEGCTYAILLMNVISPLIERAGRRRAFGEVKRRA